MNARFEKHWASLIAGLLLLAISGAIFAVVKRQFDPPEENYIFAGLGVVVLLFMVWRIRQSMKKRRAVKTPKARPTTHIAQPSDNLDLRRASTPAEAIHDMFEGANPLEVHHPTGDNRPPSYMPTLDTHLKKMSQSQLSGNFEDNLQDTTVAEMRALLKEYNEHRHVGFLIENAIIPMLISALFFILLAGWSFLFITDWERVVALREGRTDLYLPVAGFIALGLVASLLAVYRWRYIQTRSTIRVEYDEVEVQEPYNKWLGLNGTTQTHKVYDCKPLSYEKRTFLQKWGIFIRGVRKTRHVKIDVEGESDNKYLHNLPYIIEPERLKAVMDHNKHYWLKYYGRRS